MAFIYFYNMYNKPVLQINIKGLSRSSFIFVVHLFALGLVD